MPISPDLPEQAAEPEGRADEDEVVELVKIPFVEQEFVKRLEIRREPSRARRLNGCTSSTQ